MSPHRVEFMAEAKKQQQTKINLKPPKIRIVHIFAPEIIKIDREIFRETVQKLTGKPSDHFPITAAGKGCSSRSSSSTSVAVVSSKGKTKKSNSSATMLSRQEHHHHQLMVKSKFADHGSTAELSLWEKKNSSSSNGLFFKDNDGFLIGINEFPFENSSHLDG